MFSRYSRLVAGSGDPQRHRRPRAGSHVQPAGADRRPHRLEQDGEEQFETVALGWTGRNVYVRVTDTRYHFTACWLPATSDAGRAAPPLTARVTREAMTIVGRFLCRIGVHRWLHKRNPEDGAPYLECERCLKRKDTQSIADTPSGGGGAMQGGTGMG
jgi:hypothetical protein